MDTRTTSDATANTTIDALNDTITGTMSDTMTGTMAETSERTTFRTGVSDGLPVFFGYFPIAVAFGILAKSTGLSLLEAGLFSCFVFAGASQFVGVNMLKTGAGMGEIVLTTFLLNFRHFIMGAAVASKLKQERHLKAVAAFGVTDETFAVAMNRHDSFGTPYLIALNFTAWSGWLLGTLSGHLAGNLFPSGLQRVMGALLYVMFIGILVPEIRKNLRILLLVGLSGLLHVLLSMSGWLPGNWSMVVAILVSSVVYEWTMGRREPA